MFVFKKFCYTVTYNYVNLCSPMVPTVSDTSLELDTAVLEKIFIGVACLVVLLLGVLVLVLTKNRYRQSSFKLLDNAGKTSVTRHQTPIIK